MQTNQIETKRIFIYLAIVFSVYYCLWLIAILLPDSMGNAVYSFLSFPIVFMGTPALSVLLTRKITGDKSAIAYDVKVWKNKKAALFAMFVPAILISAGAVLFYLIFPNDLDYSGDYIIQSFDSFGVPSEISFTVSFLLIMGMIVCIISAFCVPSWFIALGEDIGWQGYLLPLLCKKNGCQTGSTIKWGIMGNGSCTANIFWNELWIELCRDTIQWYCYDDIILHNNWRVYVFCNIENK